METTSLPEAILYTNNPTKAVIARMLKQNTGKHMLDSGGENGRHWQRNQGVDFEAQPEARLGFGFYGPERRGEMQITFSTYHWLASRLEYHERLDDLFHKWARRPRNEDKHWLELMRGFPEYLERFGFKVEGFCGGDRPQVVYTYNEENCLSQDVQFLCMEVEGPEEWGSTPIVILQTHNGADARGGLSTPRAFVVDRDEGSDIFEYGRVALGCDGEPHPKMRCPTGGRHLPGTGPCAAERFAGYHRWSSDNGGYSWDDAGDGNVPREMRRLEVGIYELEDLADWEPGTLWVHEDAGLCPVCGSTLSVGFF